MIFNLNILFYFFPKNLILRVILPIAIRLHVTVQMVITFGQKYI